MPNLINIIHINLFQNNNDNETFNISNELPLYKYVANNLCL